MKVILSEAAALDLEEIGDEIARDNPQRARTFVGELRALCLSLRLDPARHPVLRHEPEALRQAVHGAYRIFYAVRTDHVRIVRVVHSARLVRPEMSS